MKNIFIVLLLSTVFSLIFDNTISINNINIHLFFSIFTTFTLYFCGSIPFGLIITKIKQKKDIRKVGSGNIGATNVFRTGDKLSAFLTLLGDISKGFLPLIILDKIPLDYLYQIHYILPVIGHIYPLFLKFKGGKGVATGIGTVLAFNPMIGFLMLILWGIILRITKTSSIASLVTFIILVIINMVFEINSVWIFLISALIFWHHKENISRIIHNKEKFIIR